VCLDRKSADQDRHGLQGRLHDPITHHESTGGAVPRCRTWV
jgi:hypothetical protein